MTSTLASRQQALVATVMTRTAAPGLAALPGVEGGIDRGLQAYRVNAQALSARVLAAVFPQLQSLLGTASFESMAWAFWRASPPSQSDLAQWGGALADFLAAQDGIDAEPLDLARLEWALHRAEAAADVELDALSLGLLASVEATDLVLRLRPGVQLLAAQSTGPVLVWRTAWRAHSAALTRGEAALMQALLDGVCLDRALALAGSEFDFSAWLQAALRETWLQRAERLNTP